MRRPDLNSKSVYTPRWSGAKGSDEAREGEVSVPIGVSALEKSEASQEHCQHILEDTHQSWLLCIQLQYTLNFLWKIKWTQGD